jgi:hypothetical protein
LIHADKLLLAITVFIVQAMPLPAAGNSFKNEITSSEIWSCTGSADTLWIRTAQGVNYTVNAFDSAVTWHGYSVPSINTQAFGAIACNQGSCLVPLSKHQDSSVNQILSFGFNSTQSSIRLPFNIPSFKKTYADTTPNFMTVNVRWLDNYYWMACMDAGLVRFGNADTTIFYPGRNKAYKFTSFVKDSFPRIPSAIDSQVTGIDVCPASHDVWVNRAGEIWRFASDSLNWTLIDTPGVSGMNILGITVLDSGCFFASMVTPALGATEYDTSADTVLYIYRAGPGNVWHKHEFYGKKSPDLIAVLDSGHFYMVRENNIEHWFLPDTGLPVEKHFVKGSDFAALKADIDVRSPDIYDIFYTAKQDTGLLWIATSEGLFLSHSAPFRPDSLANLRIFRRDQSVVKGLKNRNVYAFPSILNDSYRNQRAVFAYNLDKNDLVTIDVFDWNMDHVVRVVDRKPRVAGSNREDGSGVSFIRNEDYWDGTTNNHGGKSVAPGVYYFRIRAELGGQAIGKLIVAKPDY